MRNLGAPPGADCGEKEHVESGDEAAIVVAQAIVTQALLDAIGQPLGIKASLQASMSGVK